MFVDINKATCCLTGLTWQPLPCGVTAISCTTQTPGKQHCAQGNSTTEWLLSRYICYANTTAILLREKKGKKRQRRFKSLELLARFVATPLKQAAVKLSLFKNILTVNADGFIWLHGCFHDFFTLLLSHRCVRLWESCLLEQQPEIFFKENQDVFFSQKKEAPLIIFFIERRVILVCMYFWV